MGLPAAHRPNSFTVMSIKSVVKLQLFFCCDQTVRFLNCIKKEIISPIVMLFKKVLREETVPSDWRDANVVPIFKAGRRCEAANYRPVSDKSDL